MFNSSHLICSCRQRVSGDANAVAAAPFQVAHSVSAPQARRQQGILCLRDVCAIARCAAARLRPQRSSRPLVALRADRAASRLHIQTVPRRV